MRVAYLSADCGVPVFGEKNSSVQMRGLIGALERLGHDVEVLAANDGPTPAMGPLNVTKVGPAVGWQPSSTATNNADAKHARNEHHAMAVSDGALTTLIKRHLSKPFDLIYERYSLWSTAGVRAGRRLGVPVILEVNAPLLYERNQSQKIENENRARSIESEAFGGADHIVAVSDWLACYAAAKGAKKDRITVVPHGVDPEVFNPLATASSIDGAGDDPVVGFVGQLDERSGIQPLVEAFLKVRIRTGNARLMVAGDGPLRNWLEGYASGARIADAVHVNARGSYDALPGLINRMDVATLPYPDRGDFYHSPARLFEYLAMGRAVVASNIGQIPHVICNEHNGLLVEPGNVDQLAEALHRALEDPKLRARLGTAAAQTVRAHTWISNAKKLVAIAADLCASNVLGQSAR